MIHSKKDSVTNNKRMLSALLTYPYGHCLTWNTMAGRNAGICCLLDMKSQTLLLHAQDLHKTKPAKITTDGRGTHPLLLLAEKQLIIAVERVLLLWSVVTGRLPMLQFMVPYTCPYMEHVHIDA